MSGFDYEYRGWQIEPYEGIQVGHRLENSRNVSQQIGSHTARKISEYLIHYPEDSGHGSGKSVRTLKEAAAYIDSYEGSEDPAARMKKIPRVARSR
jgi:hypothetical protein